MKEAPVNHENREKPLVDEFPILMSFTIFHEITGYYDPRQLEKNQSY